MIVGENYKFFYFRNSPRGNAKLGVTNTPWQRLRMQQQGTDEEIQFDHLWLVRGIFGSGVFEIIEHKLKSEFKNKCMASKNDRAGHTEWYYDLDFETFEQKFDIILQEEKGYAYSLKIPLKEPYRATKKSQCPLNAPESYDSQYYKNLWAKIA